MGVRSEKNKSIHDFDQKINFTTQVTESFEKFKQ